MTELMYPILIYDDLCYSCTKFARIANNLVQGKCMIVGHYTTTGMEIKKQLFPKDYDGLEMFWFVINGYAYGGRAGLVRLIRYILFEGKRGEFTKNEFHLSECTTDCKTAKGVFLRSHSIITNYKKFSISKN